MRRFIFLAFILLSTIMVSPPVHDTQASHEETYFEVVPESSIEVKLDIHNDSVGSFSGSDVSVNITSPYGDEMFNDTVEVTGNSRVWFVWDVPYNASLGNYTAYGVEPVTGTITNGTVNVRIPYILVIDGYVQNSFGNSYPNYPVVFNNLNRTERVEVYTNNEGYYRAVLENTTIRNHLYGLARMDGEESYSFFEVKDNMSKSFRTQPVTDYYVNGQQGGGGGGGLSDVVTSSGDGLYVVAMGVVVGGGGAIIYAMRRMLSRK